MIDSLPATGSTVADRARRQVELQPPSSPSPSWSRTRGPAAPGAGSWRRYLAVMLAVVLLGAGGVAGFNGLIDPLWFFAHEHLLNRLQKPFDERAQKTNWLHARLGQFDAVLFGSSRATYIDQNAFAPYRMLNYAVNAMWPHEYQPYLDHFTAVNGGPPELVVLGVDFFGTRDVPIGDLRDPASYTGRAGDPRYLVSSLLSLELLERSLLTTVQSSGLLREIGDHDRYDRNNVRFLSGTITEADRARAVLEDLERFEEKVFGSTYTYSPRLPALWRELRAAYPTTRFVVFTSPVAEPMFALMVREGQVDDYERWLADLIAAFGEVWDFQGLNSVTTDLSQYRDAQHFHPRVGRLVADRLMGRPLPPERADFGRRVTRDTLAGHMDLVRRQLACLDPDPIRTGRARLAGTGGTAGCLVGQQEPAASNS